MKNNGDVVSFLKQKDYIMINNKLGNGSFGKTVLLKDPFIDELFVAKQYKPANDVIKEKFYKNFLDEIKIMYKLRHPNIVRIYNYYAYEKSYMGYIIMEYIDGQTIEDFMKGYDWFSEITLDEIFVQLIDGFCYIENHGILHRDIRESNILIDKTGLVKIIDFGIGKTFDKNLSHAEEDSLVAIINRKNSDTLPQEYYDGIYTSLTDMFYLAELFSRLKKQIEDPFIEFSYDEILYKMMQKNPKDRYKSFNDVKMAIGKNDFVNMKISESDKITYQSFVNAIYRSISKFQGERKFNNDPELFIQRLESVLKNNLFEEKIQNISEVISCLVFSSYTYYPKESILCEDVRKFLEWFRKSTHESRKIILSNIFSKFSTIKAIIEDEELPFN